MINCNRLEQERDDLLDEVKKLRAVLANSRPVAQEDVMMNEHLDEAMRSDLLGEEYKAYLDSESQMAEDKSEPSPEIEWNERLENTINFLNHLSDRCAKECMESRSKKTIDVWAYVGPGIQKAVEDLRELVAELRQIRTVKRPASEIEWVQFFTGHIVRSDWEARINGERVGYVEPTERGWEIFIYHPELDDYFKYDAAEGELKNAKAVVETMFRSVSLRPVTGEMLKEVWRTHTDTLDGNPITDWDKTASELNEALQTEWAVEELSKLPIAEDGTTLGEFLLPMRIQSLCAHLNGRGK